MISSSATEISKTELNTPSDAKKEGQLNDVSSTHLQPVVLCLEPCRRGLPLPHLHLRLLQLNPQTCGLLARALLRRALGARELLGLLPQLTVLGDQRGVVGGGRERLGLGLLERAFELVSLFDGGLKMQTESQVRCRFWRLVGSGCQRKRGSWTRSFGGCFSADRLC